VANLKRVVDNQPFRDARKLAKSSSEFLETSVRQSNARQQARNRLFKLSLPIGPITWKRDELYQR